MQKKPTPATELMSGLTKGLAVIEALSAKGQQMTIAEVARATNLTRATARRCLLTLSDCGYLVFDGKYFQPAPKIMRLGMAYLNVATLPQIAQPFLVSACEQLNETISITILEGQNSVFIARAEAEHIVKIGLRVGARLPAYSCATGRVLLSTYSDTALTEYLDNCDLVVNTPKTIVEKSTIRQAIEDVKKIGYAVTNEELALGMRSIATPVRNPSGEIIAAMSASAFVNRVSQKEMIKKFLPVLLQQSQALTNAL
ncbi:MAG: helix-turn-helix domain-containing protein [Emcibacter sp.]|nr:helix-turn-helix domain-containing protein [Emcibacter sp.]